MPSAAGSSSQPGNTNDMCPSPKKKRTSDVPTLVSTKGKGQSSRSSAYDDNFVALLAAHNISLPRRDTAPGNFAQLKARFEAPRLSISAARFSEAQYNRWLNAVEQSHRESAVLADDFPTIRGKADHASSSIGVCSNWAPIDGNVIIPAPDFWDGLPQITGNFNIRQEFGRLIMPLASYEDPFMPNLFMELKSPRGTINVARRKACYDGALSARGMFCVLTGGMDGPYDGNAYTISATYSGGTLEMFLHHVTSPETDDDLPHYHMTPVGAWALHNSIEIFRQGVSAFQNARDVAAELREQVIQAAQARMQLSTPSLSLVPLKASQPEHADEDGNKDGDEDGDEDGDKDGDEDGDGDGHENLNAGVETLSSHNGAQSKSTVF